MRIVVGEGTEVWWCEESAAAGESADLVWVRCIGQNRELLFEAPRAWQDDWSPAALRAEIVERLACQPARARMRA